MSQLKKYRWFFFIFILFLTAGVVAGCQEKVEVSQGKTLYQCSMHPNIVSSKPENCSICGMRLTRVEEVSKKILFYRNPMNPEVTSPVPAKDEMGMDYIPVYAGEGEGEGAPSSVPGHAAVRISPEKQQLIGMKTGKVEELELRKIIRVSGRVAFDIQLFVALVEYKQILSEHEKYKRGPVSIYRDKADDVLEAAQSKLKLLGYNQDLADEFLKAGKGVAYDHLEPGNAGIYADIYEYEMGLVKTGQEVEVTTPAFPGKVFKGQIYEIDPVLNAMTRTLRVRIVVKDEQGQLKPEMFVDVKIAVPLGRKLALPEEALFNAGERQIAFVDKGDGHLEPREVKVGQEADGYYEVLSGLEAGEAVVTSANFLIDSESRFQSVIQSFTQGGHEHGEK